MYTRQLGYQAKKGKLYSRPVAPDKTYSIFQGKFPAPKKTIDKMTLREPYQVKVEEKSLGDRKSI